MQTNLDSIVTDRIKELAKRIRSITEDYGYMRKLEDKSVLGEFCEDANELGRWIGYLNERGII